MTESKAMQRAIYLHPDGLNTWPHFNNQVMAWLRSEGIEPVDGGEHEVVVCLPYGSGDNFYHRDVSIGMARQILDQFDLGGEVRWIFLRDTETNWKDDSLEEVRLDWADGGYGSKLTIALMSPAEKAEADREISEEGRLDHKDLGVRWRPKPPTVPGVFISARINTLSVTAREIALLQQIAAEKPDGIVKDPTRRSKFMELMEGLGFVETFELEGSPAWRLTDKGRQVAA